VVVAAEILVRGPHDSLRIIKDVPLFGSSGTSSVVSELSTDEDVIEADKTSDPQLDRER